MKMVLCVLAVYIASLSMEEMTMPARFNDIFYQLWKDSSFGRDPNRTERAAWILREPSGEYGTIAWPPSRARNEEFWHGPMPKNAIAQAHTHPECSQPQPSTTDVALCRRIGVPIYTISDRGIWVATPDGKITKVTNADWTRRPHR